MGSINPQEKQPEYYNNINQLYICSEIDNITDNISCIPCGILEQKSQVSDFQNSAQKQATGYICSNL